jgi:hypothetical protein
MSMFYCDYHDRLEDSDEVGYHIDSDDWECCNEGKKIIDIKPTQKRRESKDETHPR